MSRWLDPNFFSCVKKAPNLSFNYYDNNHLLPPQNLLIQGDQIRKVARFE
jgi:hypothetical protein